MGLDEVCGSWRSPMGRGTNIAQNMTFANIFHEPPAGVTGAAPTGRRRGAGPPRRPHEAVVRPPLPGPGTGNIISRAGNFCTRAGKFLHESREVFAQIA